MTDTTTVKGIEIAQDSTDELRVIMGVSGSLFDALTQEQQAEELKQVLTQEGLLDATTLERATLEYSKTHLLVQQYKNDIRSVFEPGEQLIAVKISLKEQTPEQQSKQPFTGLKVTRGGE